VSATDRWIRKKRQVKLVQMSQRGFRLAGHGSHSDFNHPDICWKATQQYTSNADVWNALTTTSKKKSH